MWQKTLTWSAVAAAVALLAGCGSGGGNSGSSVTHSSLTTSGPGEIYYGNSATYTTTETTFFPDTQIQDYQFHVEGAGSSYATVGSSTCTDNGQCTTPITDNNTSDSNQSIEVYATATYQGNPIASPAVPVTLKRQGVTPPIVPDWPMTIKNDTGSAVEMYVYGSDSNGKLAMLSFDGSGNPTEHTYADDPSNPPSAATYHTELSAGAEETFNIPYPLNSARMYFAYEGGAMQNIAMTSNTFITQPAPWKHTTGTFTAYDNQNVIFNWVEFTYGPNGIDGKTSAAINETEVDEFAWPIYIYSSSNASGPTNYNPVYQVGLKDITRDQLLNYYINHLHLSGNSTAWNNLIYPSNYGSVANIKRINNPSHKLSSNYFDNYLSAVENYYAAGQHSLVIYGPSEHTKYTLTNEASGVFTFNFTDASYSGTISINVNQDPPASSLDLLLAAQSNGIRITSYQPVGMTTKEQAAVIAKLAQMFSAAFMDGQLPPTEGHQITQTYLQSKISGVFSLNNSYFSINSDQRSYFSYIMNQLLASSSCGLTLGGTGPCKIYSYAYNDVLGISSDMTAVQSDLVAPKGITIELEPQN